MSPVTVRHSHLDAAQTVWLGRELEAVDKMLYEEVLPGSKARSYFPPILDVAEWQNVYTYKMFKPVGQTKVSSRNSDDSPRVTLTMTPASQNIKEITDAYGWTVSEIERAAGSDTPLDRMTAMTAKAVTDRKIDDLLATGDSTLGITGALNISGLSATTASTKTSGTDWLTNAASDPGKCINDVSAASIALFKALKQTDAPGFDKLTVILPTAAYGAGATTARSANSDTTILKFIEATNPFIESIVPWWQCDTAGASSSGRMMLYPKNPVWGGALVPMEFKPLPPQERGQEIIVNTRASCGGVICRYPVATAYVDGV